MRSVILLSLLCLIITPVWAQEYKLDSVQMHEEAIKFPSAAACGTCHPNHFRQWAVSPHAYGQLSPVFNAMQATTTKRTNGTNGDFCIRCHTTEGMALKESVFTANEERSQIAREGVNCVTCHRINQAHGKISARLTVQEEDIYGTIYGPRGGEELKRVQSDNTFNVATANDKARRFPVHLEAQRFFAITKPGFCGACHDVTLMNGFRLEEAFSEYKNSPAAKNGVTCQDCHMGKTLGLFTGSPETNYNVGPAAIVNGKPTRPRKLTDHMIAGPDHSIIHPGIYPHNVRAAKMATISEWLTFDYKAGWGTEEFEDRLPKGYTFPKRWTSYDDRIEAREIIDDQIKLLNEYMAKRIEVLSNGYQIGQIVTEQADERGIRFKVQVKNPSDGHNVPTGFAAERPVYLQVTVTDSDGKIIFQSGDLDPNGDLRETHSVYVQNGIVPKDKYLFNLQSEFIIQNVRGSDRHPVIPTNLSIDALPFIRPSTFSAILTGRPAGARTHRMTIPPLGSYWPEYEVKKSALTGKGPYRATVKLLAGMVPVNLVHEVEGVGFDYGMSTRQVADAIVERHALLGEYEAIIDTHKDARSIVWQQKAVTPALWDRSMATDKPQDSTEKAMKKGD
ncbi:MAG: hypothetical protein HY710_03885 [Candidatus Latescibacteria bacterium]|nr:hypothetical protein [Candidatus Latescibacterota bacterium]